jgi:hypothetical protein
VPIDTLSFEYSVINLDEKELLAPPKEGVYVKVGRGGGGQGGSRAKARW